jgi:hypothetical protein
MNRFRRFCVWSMGTQSRLTLIWGAVFCGTLVAIGILVFIVGWPSVTAVALVIFLSFLAGYLWGIVMWWYFRAMRRIRRRRAR